MDNHSERPGQKRAQILGQLQVEKVLLASLLHHPEADEYPFTKSFIKKMICCLFR